MTRELDPRGGGPSLPTSQWNVPFPPGYAPDASKSRLGRSSIQKLPETNGHAASSGRTTSRGHHRSASFHTVNGFLSVPVTNGRAPSPTPPAEQNHTSRHRAPDASGASASASRDPLSRVRQQHQHHTRHSSAPVTGQANGHTHNEVGTTGQVLYSNGHNVTPNTVQTTTQTTTRTTTSNPSANGTTARRSSSQREGGHQRSGSAQPSQSQQTAAPVPSTNGATHRGSSSHREGGHQRSASAQPSQSQQSQRAWEQDREQFPIYEAANTRSRQHLAVNGAGRPGTPGFRRAVSFENLRRCITPEPNQGPLEQSQMFMRPGTPGPGKTNRAATSDNPHAHHHPHHNHVHASTDDQQSCACTQWDHQVGPHGEDREIFKGHGRSTPMHRVIGSGDVRPALRNSNSRGNLAAQFASSAPAASDRVPRAPRETRTGHTSGTVQRSSSSMGLNVASNGVSPAPSTHWSTQAVVDGSSGSRRLSHRASNSALNAAHAAADSASASSRAIHGVVKGFDPHSANTRPKAPVPPDNLSEYLRRARISKWTEWSEIAPVEACFLPEGIRRPSAHKRLLAMGYEWICRFQAADDLCRQEAQYGQPSRTLHDWNARDATKWRKDMQSYLAIHIPVKKHRTEQWGKGIFALDAEGFDTQVYRNDNDIASDKGLFSWLSACVLETALSVLHMLRANGQAFRFHLLADFATRSEPVLHDGFGTLALSNLHDDKDRRIVVAIRPPSIVSGSVMRAFAAPNRHWQHVRRSDPEHSSAQANLLQAQIYDECMTNGAKFFIVTTTKYWAFGEFNDARTRCTVSPAMLYDSREPTVIQCLVAWLLKAYDGSPPVMTRPSAAERDAQAAERATLAAGAVAQETQARRTSDERRRHVGSVSMSRDGSNQSRQSHQSHQSHPSQQGHQPRPSYASQQGLSSRSGLRHSTQQSHSSQPTRDSQRISSHPQQRSSRTYAPEASYPNHNSLDSSNHSSPRGSFESPLGASASSYVIPVSRWRSRPPPPDYARQPQHVAPPPPDYAVSPPNGAVYVPHSHTQPRVLDSLQYTTVAPLPHVPVMPLAHGTPWLGFSQSLPQGPNGHNGTY